MPSLLFLLLACAGTQTTLSEPAAPPPPVAASPAPASPSLAPADAIPTAAGDVTVQPVYHGTLMVKEGGRTWIVDPWTQAPMGDVKADVVLVTDNHPDHLDLAAIASVRKEGTIVVGPQVVADAVAVDVILRNGETKDVAGAKVTAVPMYNLERGPEPGKLFHDKGRGNGYIIELAGADPLRIYVAGDTECTAEMKALESIDVAFLPMNLPYTMPPNEAVECIKAFKPGIVYPYHYGGSDLDSLEAALVGSGVELRNRDWYPGGQPQF